MALSKPNRTSQLGPIHGQREWIGPSCEVLFGLESAIAIAQQNAHAVAVVVRHGEIRLTVAVKIYHGHGEWTAPGCEVLLGGESPIAIAQQDAHRVAQLVCHG